MPYIPFKARSTGRTGGKVWEKLFHFYSFQREEFLEHYHKRSNVETTFSMIKAKFGERLRCKTEVVDLHLDKHSSDNQRRFLRVLTDIRFNPVLVLGRVVRLDEEPVGDSLAPDSDRG